MVTREWETVAADSSLKLLEDKGMIGELPMQPSCMVVVCGVRVVVTNQANIKQGLGQRETR
eukprot:CAMPEP_0194761816 /NCGR_PEP_ID=MMETSP0323_2-20130528/14452_1 /TAXON_ID=2866 ORGANISM="Crypthecodinium cohnii, Strain Seligo" /NCGR_SAMPLE_ID=MMETSP0323_2 /ASSEMBLY_ACC=CAM_ASM_000346 /LENGTH=60 /DNA_ID=CAMNT_0039683723 /DNA_START=130 /DNA_END=312 /DNA_ORIENTATION=+